MKKLFLISFLCFSFLTSTIYSEEFFTKIPIWGGEVDNISICISSPDVIYACGCYGGLWVSKNAGETWEETNFYDTETSGTGSGIIGGASYVAVHSSLPNIVVASQFSSFANKVFRSEDYGQTWTEVGNSEIYSQNVNIKRIISSRKTAGIFYLLGNNFTTKNGVLYKSTDEGKTWTKISDVTNGKAVWDMSVDENDIIYVLVVNAEPSPDLKIESLSSGWLYRSTDGINWTNIKTFNSCPQYISVSSNTVAVASTGGSEAGVHISTNNGQSFVYKTGSYRATVVSLDGFNIYSFNNGKIYISSSTGSSWCDFVAISTGVLDGTRMIEASTILIDPANPSNMYISDKNEYAFLKSTDAGITWSVSNKGLGGLIVYDGCKDPSGNIYVLGRTTVFKSTDNGNTWNEVFNSVTTQFEKGVISAPTANDVFVSGGGRLWRSSDGGNTWTQVLYVGYSAEAASKIVFNKANPSVGYIAFYDASPTGETSRKYIYKTTDSGATWSQLDLTGYSVQSLVMDPNDPTILYAGLGDLHPTKNTEYYSYGGLWKIVDNGNSVSWSKISLDGYIPWRIAIDTAGVLIVSCIDKNDPTPYKYNRPTYFSTDGGISWKDITINSIGLTSASDIEYSNGSYYLSTGDGVYATNNLIAPFKLIAHKRDIGDPKCLVVGSMYAGANRGFYKLSGMLSSSYSGDKVKIYAFPNPFKAGETSYTTLKYFVPQQQTVSSLKISIYNITGELVYEFPEYTNLSGGYAYYYAWDGKNQSGNLCSRGVYIVVFKSNLGVAKTKVVLVK
ncbi:MAG: hypothetical protein N2Z73_05030 [Endomicrobia bacterium]|nr:hypothetical protein [Endomicrobiia bacterium]